MCKRTSQNYGATMNEWKSIFTNAKTSLVVMAAFLISSIAAVLVSRYVSDGISTSVGQLKSTLQKNQIQLETQQDDLKNMQSHINRYEILRNQGLVGEPDRALWVEQMQESRKRLKLPEAFAVELRAAQPIGVSVDSQNAPSAQGEAQQPQWHDLQFEIHDVHEIEVLQLVQEFRGHVKGRFRVQSCKLQEPKDTGLIAICTLRFVTIPAIAPKKPDFNGMMP